MTGSQTHALMTGSHTHASAVDPRWAGEPGRPLLAVVASATQRALPRCWSAGCRASSSTSKLVATICRN
jgi:hypothetical protein